MSTNRQAATAAIEAAGIVAVIRIKDPAKLQAVVDAISEGGRAYRQHQQSTTLYEAHARFVGPRRLSLSTA